MIKGIIYATIGLLLAAGLGLMMQKDPGYVLIQFDKTTVEMSFWLFAFGLFATLLTILIIFHYWLRLKIMLNMRSLRSQRDVAVKRIEQIEQFLRYYALGQYAKARRSIPKISDQLKNWWQAHLSYKLDEQPIVTTGSDVLSQQITFREALDNGELPAEVPEQLPADVLLLAFDAACHTHQFSQAEQAFSQLTDWLDKDELYELEATLVAHRIEHMVAIGDSQAAFSVYDSLPKVLKRDAGIALPIAQLYHYQGSDEEAKSVIETVLKHENDSQLTELYGKLAVNNLDKMFKTAERWQKQYPDDPYLLILLGRISDEMGLSSQAQNYYEASIALDPTHTAYAALAVLFEKQDRLELAMKAYRQGCLLTKN